MTYGEIAEKTAEQMNRPHMSAQAVGGAVGHNPISLIIPCHRVIGANGSLTGYAGGVDRKRRLLEMDAKIDIQPFFCLIKNRERSLNGRFAERTAEKFLAAEP